MAAKSSSLLQGISAGLRNLNLTKKRGIDHEEVRSIVFQSSCCVAGTLRQPSVARVISMWCVTVNINFTQL